MTDSRLTALSPLDGRYADKCADLAALFSEAALIRFRVRVEAAWYRQLARSGQFPVLASLPAALDNCLAALSRGVDEAGVRRVKELERQTNHDVKAVEYYVREQLAAAGARAGAARAGPLRLHLGRHQQPELCPDAGRGARARAAPGNRPGRRQPRGARRPPCRDRDALAHPRPAGIADHARQGGGEFHRAPATRGQRAAARRSAGQVERRGRQLQRARRRRTRPSTGARNRAAWSRASA